MHAAEFWDADTPSQHAACRTEKRPEPMPRRSVGAKIGRESSGPAGDRRKVAAHFAGSDVHDAWTVRRRGAYETLSVPVVAADVVATDVRRRKQDVPCDP